MMHATNDADAMRLIELVASSWKTEAVAVAAELGLADRIAAAGGRATSAALAATTRSEPDAMRRLLDALCALGVCAEAGPDTYALTATGELLRDGPGRSLRGFALYWGRHIVPVWRELGASVQTGLSWRKRRTGRERFEQLETHPQQAAEFDRSMGEVTAWVAADAARLLDGVDGNVVDIGGGDGALLIPILLAHPGLHGIDVDFAGAVAAARRRAATAGLDDRFEGREGDFFQSVPAGAGTYLLKSILHDWDDGRCATILGCIRAAIPPGGRLFVIERVRPDRLEPRADCVEVARNDLNMLVAVGGRERTDAQYRALLEAAGFEVVARHPLPLCYTAVEARPR